MPRECGKQAARALEIVAELRAAELVREGMNAVDARTVTLAREPREAFGRAIDAADGRQDPDLVAGRDAPVRAAIAAKLRHLGSHRCNRCSTR